MREARERRLSERAHLSAIHRLVFHARNHASADAVEAIDEDASLEVRHRSCCHLHHRAPVWRLGVWRRTVAGRSAGTYFRAYAVAAEGVVGVF
jgi:hypothetical protein